jgi:hypothetical protein
VPQIIILYSLSARVYESGSGIGQLKKGDEEPQCLGAIDILHVTFIFIPRILIE